MSVEALRSQCVLWAVVSVGDIHQLRLGESLDILLSKRQLLRQTVAVRANELLAALQILDFDGDSEENKVQGSEPVAERFDSPRHKPVLRRFIC